MIKKSPTHLVLYPDGNRRWARKRGLPPTAGHFHGTDNILRFCKWCKKVKIKMVTIFGFSTENWSRPKDEIKYLLQLFETAMLQHMDLYKKDGIRIKVLGQREKLPKSLQKTIKKIEEATEKNEKIQLNLAVSYGGRWDIVQAIKSIIKSKIPYGKINEDLVYQHLSTANMPEPDLVIRTGGEQRLSNFLIWQGAYSEFYFSDKYWPEFTEKDLGRAIEEYNRRQRRFGK